MQHFLARENIRRFEHMLATSTDEQQKKMLRELLAAEKAKLTKPEVVAQP